MTATASPRWYGYVEEHDITDDDRRAEGRAQRLARTPDAVLATPDEVAQWLTAQSAIHGRRADDDARQRNALIGDRSSINRSVAAKAAASMPACTCTAIEWSTCASRSRPATAAPARAGTTSSRTPRPNGDVATAAS